MIWSCFYTDSLIHLLLYFSFVYITYFIGNIRLFTNLLHFIENILLQTFLKWDQSLISIVDFPSKLFDYTIFRFCQLTTLVNCVQHSQPLKRANIQKSIDEERARRTKTQMHAHSDAWWVVLLLVVRDFGRLLEPVTKRLVAVPQFVCAASWMQNASTTNWDIYTRNRAEYMRYGVRDCHLRELIRVYLNGIILLAFVVGQTRPSPTCRRICCVN